VVTFALVVALAVLGFPAAVALSWLYVGVPDTGTPASGESEDAVGGAAIAPFQAAPCGAALLNPTVEGLYADSIAPLDVEPALWVRMADLLQISTHDMLTLLERDMNRHDVENSKVDKSDPRLDVLRKEFQMSRLR
jgi:hypothetical protein